MSFLNSVKTEIGCSVCRSILFKCLYIYYDHTYEPVRIKEEKKTGCYFIYFFTTFKAKLSPSLDQEKGWALQETYSNTGVYISIMQSIMCSVSLIEILQQHLSYSDCFQICQNTKLKQLTDMRVSVRSDVTVLYLMKKEVNHGIRFCLLYTNCKSIHR